MKLNDRLESTLTRGRDPLTNPTKNEYVIHGAHARHLFEGEKAVQGIDIPGGNVPACKSDVCISFQVQSLVIQRRTLDSWLTIFRVLII